jgi:hypothetical protein
LFKSDIFNDQLELFLCRSHKIDPTAFFNKIEINELIPGFLRLKDFQHGNHLLSIKSAHIEYALKRVMDKPEKEAYQKNVKFHISEK